MNKFLVSKVICSSLDYVKKKENPKDQKIKILLNLEHILKEISQQVFFIEILPGILSEFLQILLQKHYFRVKIQILQIYSFILEIQSVHETYTVEILKIMKILSQNLLKEENTLLKLGFLKLLRIFTDLQSKDLSLPGKEFGIFTLLEFLEDQDSEIAQLAEDGLRYE